MAKPDMRAALEASLRGEEKSVADRLAKADAFFTSPTPRPSDEQPALPESPSTRHEKVIRDGFTMPAGDYKLIAEIQAHCLQSGMSLTKSEVVRAGLHALKGMPPEQLKQIVTALTKVKPGRPSAS